MTLPFGLPCDGTSNHNPQDEHPLSRPVRHNLSSIMDQPKKCVKTRILVVSDTHGQAFNPPLNPDHIDVVVHCGDFTQHSKLSEMKMALQLLDNIDSTLKLIIPGNHDFSLDPPIFKEKIDEARRLTDDLDDGLVQAAYGKCGDAKDLFQSARERGIYLLTEGTYHFALKNGASLKVYASPYTPCPSGEQPTWGFQYSDGHEFDIEQGTELVLTHGPPRGIFDMSPEKRRLGCSDLFSAVARARPKVHCFGHVHNGWGAKVARWREIMSEHPSHFTDIDHGKSNTIQTLATLRSQERQRDVNFFCHATYSRSELGQRTGMETLFINAAVQGEHGLDRPPWIVEVDLQCVSQN